MATAEKTPRYVDRAVKGQASIYRRHRGDCPAATGGRCRCSGRYFARLRIDGRQRNSPMVDTLAEAQKERGRLQTERRPGETTRGRTAPVAKLTVAQAMKRFLDAAERGAALAKGGKPFRPRTIDDYRFAFSGHMEEAIGEVPLDELRRGQVQAALDLMAEVEGLGPSRRRNVATAMRSLVGWASGLDLCERGLLDHLSLPAPARKKRSIFMPADVIEHLWRLRHRPDLVAGWAIGAFTGARAQEIGALRWLDIDLEQGRISLADDDDAVKTAAAVRTVGIVAPLAAILTWAYEAAERPEPSTHVTPGDAATRPYRRAENLRRHARDLWAAQVDEDGQETAPALPDLGLHDLRHGQVSWLMAAGVPLPAIREWVGHKAGESLDRALGASVSGVTLNVYGHVVGDWLSSTTATLDAWIAGQLNGAQAARLAALTD